MPRVVIDARSVTGRRSGIGHYVEELARRIVPLADDLRFLVLRHPDATQPLVDSERVDELAFRGETKSTATVFGLGRAHSFAREDLYHSPADIVPLGLGCPFVVTIHDLMWVEARKLASAFLPVRLANGAWYTINIGRAVRGARRVIAISRATADAIGRVYPDHAHKVRVVHHGLDHELYSPERAGPRASIAHIVPEGVRYALVVGQGSPYKNHAGMIRAFVEATRFSRDDKLVLVRRFSRVDREMHNLLRSPEVSAKVIAVPFVADAELLALYRHAHALLFASHYEGFGFPALEAMSLGTPVLASTAPAVLEITGDAALHAISTDHADLVAKIRELWSDAALRERLIAAGTARAREFSWDKCARATLEVYREAMAQR